MGKIKFIVIAITSVLLFSCGKGEKVTLRMKPPVGTEYKYKGSYDMVMGSMMGNTEMNMDMGINMFIKNITADGNVEVDLTYSKLGMEMSMMGKTISFSSDDIIADSLDPKFGSAQIFKALTMVKVPMVFNSRGKIVEFSNINDLLPDSIQMLAKNSNTQTENYEQMMENMFANFPEEEVYAGYTWNQKSEMKSLGGPIAVDAKYTIVAITADEVEIKIEGTISGDVVSQGMPVNMNGTMGGTLKVEKETGMTKSVEMKQDFVMKIMGMETNVTGTISMIRV